ncbi:MAG TPA: hypothetical protein VLB67_10285 [Acidimicrobiia bacterium]|nr:hypothetical protein [Acidimicrobiia bacterium]
MDIFPGTLTLDDGERVPVDVALDDENLTLRTGGRAIGTWPLKYCRVSPSGRGAVLLSLDGERTVFEPDDMGGFSTIAAQRFRASSLADRISVIRDVPAMDEDGESARDQVDRREPWWSERILRPLLLVTVALGMVAGVVWWQARDSDSLELAGTTLTVPTTLEPPPPLFEQTLARFTEEWNLAASAFGVPVQIRGVLTPGRFESQLTPFVIMQGRTGIDGTIDSIVLVIDPTGGTSDDETALASIGVALAVASPDLSRQQRGAVLAEMGLAVRNPDLTGLDGAVEVGPVAYAVRYIPEFQSLLFTVNPA